MTTPQTACFILENELLRAEISPDKSAAVKQLIYKPSGLPLFPDCDAHSAEGANALGGWFESLPNMGALDALHSQAVFAAIWSSQSSVTLSGVAPHAPVKIEKTYSLTPNALTLSETLWNQTESEIEIFWGQNFCLGSPFYGPGLKLEIPASSYFDPREDPILRLRWPLLADGTDLSKLGPGTFDQKLFYLSDFTEGRYRVVSRSLDLVFELNWNATQFPYCWLMENSPSGAANWRNQTNTLCLNPFTGLPQALKEGHGLLSIPARGSVTARFECAVAPVDSAL